jgi:hypothetical protein
MTNDFTTISESSQLIELTESDLETISAAEWFKDIFGFSSPRFLSYLDNKARERVHGGWIGVAGAVVRALSGGTVATF